MHEYQQMLADMEAQRVRDAPVMLRQPVVGPIVQPGVVWTPEVPQKAARVDPVAQRLAGAGVLCAGVGAAGWGLSFMFTALAQATTALGFVLGIVAVVAFMRSNGSKGSNGAVNVTVRNEVVQKSWR